MFEDGTMLVTAGARGRINGLDTIAVYSEGFAMVGKSADISGQNCSHPVAIKPFLG